MNRILTVCLCIAWLVPIAGLLFLPGERAAMAATATEILLRDAPSPEEVGRALGPDAAREASRNLEVAAAIASDPKLMERRVWRRWSALFAAVMVGLLGAWALWRQRRYWRTLTLCGLVAFAAIVDFHHALEIVSMSGGSSDVLATLASLYAGPAILTHVFGPIVIACCLVYLALSLRSRQWSRITGSSSRLPSHPPT